MAGIARLNDITTGVCLIHGPQKGKITTASGNVFANKQSVARLGDTVTADCGDIGTIDSASGTVTSTKEKELSAARLGDSFSGVYSGTIDGPGTNPPNPPTVTIGS